MHAAKPLTPILASIFALALAAPSVAAPLLYQMNSPLYDGTPHTVTVYQRADFAVAVHNPSDADALRPQEGQAPELVGQGPPYATADELDGLLLKGQRLQRWYFRIPELAEFEPGSRYTEQVDPPGPRSEPFQREWWIENLEVSWQQGDEDLASRESGGREAQHVVVEVAYDYCQLDEVDQALERQRVESRRDFWFVDALPFSPLQLLPHRIVNDSRFVDFNRSAAPHVNKHVYRQLLPRLREAGMLVRTRIGADSEPVIIALGRVEEDRTVDVSRYRSWPRIPESRETPAIGAMMMKEMVGDASTEDPAGTLDIPVGVDGKTVAAASSFQVTDNGDLAVASLFETDSGGDGMVLLLRAHHGMPEPGTFEMGRQLERDALQAMSVDELTNYAERFQTYGLYEDADGNITTFTGTGNGMVEVKASDPGSIAGDVDFEVEAVELFGDGTIEIRHINGTFDASRPLEGRIFSPVSQILKRRSR